MANPHILIHIKRWLRNTSKQVYSQFARLVRRLLHRLAPPRRRRSERRMAGFVLPTAMMLLLVLSLVVGAILLRTISRTEQAMLSRRDRVIYNAATPAIDRAKAKLENLFQIDPRLPSGIPAQELLTELMEDDDTYTLPDEERIDLNGDGTLDNAWVYQEASGLGEGENNLRVAYSIIWDVPSQQEELANQSARAIETRAENLEVRQGPIASEPRPGCVIGGGGSPIENGWLRDPSSSAILRKNFQIDAFVISDREDGAVTTLEVQQEREANRGNKWGAWFRNDLEIYPGPEFRWNGAMHTDGSLIVGHNRRTDRTQAYLVSSPDSCIYQAGQTTSEITLGLEINSERNVVYQGELMAGRVVSNASQGGGIFHLWTPPGETPIHHENEAGRVTLVPDNHSVGNGDPEDVILDPITLFTEDVSKHRGLPLLQTDRVAGWSQFPIPESEEEVQRGSRVFNEPSERPFIDDFYRADDRFGPKPVYGGDDDLQLIQEEDNGETVGLGVRVGEPIASGASGDVLAKLTQLSVPGSGDSRELGLDGYWERRAWREGLRVIVGQRLELGNDPFAGTTQVDNDPNSPQQIADDGRVDRDRRAHEYLQHRTLRDNLAAAQTTAIYHYSQDGGDPDQAPTAAILSTVHPGTAETLKRAAIFEQPKIPFGVTGDAATLFNGATFGDDPDELLVDFFTGRGTNGWELNLDDLDILNTDVQNAMDNLANLAGDPDGAFPALQEANQIHPNPAITEWGDFSNLRRTLDPSENLDSLADYSNKYNAALTLGALAYNVSYLSALDYSTVTAQLTALGDRLGQLRDGDPDHGEVFFFPTEDLGDIPNDYDYSDGSTIEEDFNGDGDANDDIASLIIIAGDGWPDAGDAVVRMTPSPEAYIEALKYTDTSVDSYDTEELQELARLVYLKEQVKRDREFGFLPSPTGKDAYQSDISFNVAGFGDLDFTDADIEDDILALTADICGEDAPLDDCLEVIDIDDSTEDQETVTVSFLPGLAIGQGEEYEIDSTGTLTIPLSFGCDVNANNFFGLGNTPEGITLANTLCGATSKFPSLYYLFPLTDHGYPGSDADGREQPESEADIDEDTLAEAEVRGIMDRGADLNNDGDTTNDEIWYISDPDVQTINSGITYNAIDDAALANLAIRPIGEATNFTLPYLELTGLPTGACDNDASADDPNPNCQRNNLVYNGVEDAYYRVAFKDTAFFVGRDMMNARTLNMDMALLSDNVDGAQNTSINSDTWLPGGDDSDNVQKDGGIVYAFRDDAMREDGIERASGGGSCDDASDIGNGCNSNVLDGTDPPVNPENGISPKAVNFVPDPDRRIHGFRVINGQTVERPTDGTLPFGLSFVSDNPTFIQGNFNCHTQSGNCDQPIEEFTNLLGTDWGPTQFYGRSSRDNNFADPESDNWRYSEFLVDAIGILSDNFCDGSLEDPFIVVHDSGSNEGNPDLSSNLQALGRSDNGRVSDVYGCDQAENQQITSYLGLPRPDENANLSDNSLWLRENPADPASPIRISANGDPMLFRTPTPEGAYDGSYFDLDSGANRPLISAREPQRVNSVIVSGITPSRNGQSYGGLHNYPRLNEDWNPTRNFADPRDLVMSGSFLQLSFSNYATGPYDQSAWEPGDDPEEDEVIDYYFAPERLWGYDVALQLARVGPVSSRLITVNRARSEFYREPSADDPYIKNLRCATGPDGEQVDPRATDCD